MNKEKQIQIPERLFNLIAVMALDETQRTDQNYDQLKKGITDKLNRQIDHDYYSQYKSAPTEEQREAFRQQYLDRKGIPDNFRW